MPAYKRTVELPGRTAQELYDRIAGEIDRFLAKTSLGNFDLTRFPEKKEIHLKSSMFTGKLSCASGAVSLEGQLSFMAAPFRGKLDEGIDRWLAKTFNA